MNGQVLTGAIALVLAISAVDSGTAAPVQEFMRDGQCQLMETGDEAIGKTVAPYHS
jgi:hypothetical protein